MMSFSAKTSHGKISLGVKKVSFFGDNKTITQAQQQGLVGKNVVRPEKIFFGRDNLNYNTIS